MKKLLLLFSIVLMFVFSGCAPQKIERGNSQDSSMFVVVEETMCWAVVYHKDTKVMYAVSCGAYNIGTFTMLCDKDGKPQLWRGDYYHE